MLGIGPTSPVGHTAANRDRARAAGARLDARARHRPRGRRRRSSAGWIPATAGTVGFLIRLVTIGDHAADRAEVAGVTPQALAAGGAFTAVVLGLAAQQTLGNLFAGMVLLSARPFRVGERVRLQAGAVGGSRGHRQLARPAVHDARARRGPDHDPQQRRARGGRRAAREPEPVDVRVRLDVGRAAEPGAGDPRRADLDADASTATVLLEEIDGDEWWSGSRRRPSAPTTAPSSPTRSSPRSPSVTGEHEVATGERRS